MPGLSVVKNGMLVAKDLRLVSVDGKEIAPRGIHKLCRCGDSRNKPFCDDTHKQTGFSGDKSADRQPEDPKEFAGDEVTVLDDRGVCAHAGFCTDLLPSVFQSGKEPWINPDAGPAQDILDVVRRCPSGALAYRLAGGDVEDSFSDDPHIVVAPDGPFRVRGGPNWKDPDGNVPRSMEHFSLCRCGQSKNKPFCDGTHWYVNFGHKGAETTEESETNGFVELGGVDEFAEGHPRAVDAEGVPLAVFKLWGRVCAVAAEHDGGSLVDGALEGGRIISTAGKGYTPYPWTRAPDDDLPVHDVLVRDGRVWASRAPVEHS